MNDVTETAAVNAQTAQTAQTAEVQGAILQEQGAGAANPAHEADFLKYKEGQAKFATLPAKYGMTLLALSMEYVKLSTIQGCVVTDEDLALVEAFQDQAHLMAAATLCNTGKF